MHEVGFEAFVAARSGALFGTALLLTGDRHLAEDLLRTALAKSWLAWRRITGDPEAYVRRVLVNTYVSMWRRRWNGETPTETLPEEGRDEAGAEVRHDLRLALRRLPRRQRAVVVLRYVEDLSERQVAELLGCSVGTVKSQASRALAKLAADTNVPRRRFDPAGRAEPRPVDVGRWRAARPGARRCGQPAGHHRRLHRVRRRSPARPLPDRSGPDAAGPRGPPRGPRGRGRVRREASRRAGPRGVPARVAARAGVTSRRGAGDLSAGHE
ncbi:MAG: SigE family RNA polymerase sigma factor [Nocardioidaceae bacterium]|nr:SigE family RNA polymerase sigma factor [Nocardioidaceae bacterium]NUS53180.1 SigE family RNA polymerase sigma factor [Nocardioidaceae bacterium]